MTVVFPYPLNEIDIKHKAGTHQKFSIRGEQPGAINLHFTILHTQAVLDGEPVQL